MLKGFLISDPGGSGQRRVPVGRTCSIGRSSECTVFVDDPAASRQHVLITYDGQLFRWRDLGSTNGTLVNGARMLEGRLAHGDVIQIGETLLRFETLDAREETPPDEETTCFRDTITSWQEAAPCRPGSGSAEDLLRAVYAVSNELSSNYDTCGLVDRVLETSMRAIDAQRGAVLFTDEGREQLLPCPSCGRFHVVEGGQTLHVDSSAVRVSRTVARHVLTEGQSVLYGDTRAS